MKKKLTFKLNLLLLVGFSFIDVSESSSFIIFPPVPLGVAQCVDAGLTGCCTGGGGISCGPYTNSAGSCFCDTSCHGFGDCCDNIEYTCPTPTVSESAFNKFSQVAQCVDAGLTECCTFGGGISCGPYTNGEGSNCYCDTTCFSFGDCCDNIADTCLLSGTAMITVSVEPAPPFPAASEVTVTCSAESTSGSTTFLYKWLQFCSNDEALVATSVLYTGQSSTVTMLTNVPICADYVRCVAIDPQASNGFNTFDIPIQITGTGLNAGLQSIPGNVAVLTTDAMNGYILCGTGAVGADTGTWYDPVGTELTPTSSPVSRVVNTNNAIAGYTSLVGVAATPGVYTCEMPNVESGDLDYHTVSLYPSNFFQVGATLTGEIKFSSASLVEMDVTSSVAPPTTVTWYGPTGAVLVEDGSTVFQISSDIMDRTTVSYVHKLVMFPELPGVYRLEVGTEYYTADIANQTIIAPASSFYFLGYIVGSDFSVTCEQLGDSSIETQWLLDGDMLSQGYPAILEISSFSDTLHSKSYTCRNQLGGGEIDVTYLAIVIVPDDAIIIDVSQDSAPTAGMQHRLYCNAAKAYTGLSEDPMFTWYKDGAEVSGGDGISLVTTVSGTTETQTLTFDVLRTSHAGDYTCEVSLSSPALNGPLTVDAIITVPVSIATPVLSVTVSPDSAYLTAGTTATLSCHISINAAVDTAVTVSGLWTDPSGGLIHTGARDTVSNVEEIASNEYRFELTISPLVALQDNGTFSCLATASSSDVLILDSSSTADTTLYLIPPTLDVSLDKDAVLLLDFEPYDVFSLTCTVVSSPDLVSVTRSVVWKRNGTLLTSTGDTTIVETGSGSELMTSQLNTKDPDIGVQAYTCEATIDLLLDPDVVQTADAIVTVNGPVPPYPPVDLVTVFSDLANVRVEWRIPLIAYTTETYYIKYGPGLSSVTASIPGSDDRTAVNGLFEFTITGLTGETCYDYVVVAVNVHGETESDISMFCTEELPLGIAFSTDGLSTAGFNNFVLTCKVLEEEAITTIPIIQFLGPDGNNADLDPEITLTSTQGSEPFGGMIVTTYTLQLSFDPLKTSHGGNYTCAAELRNIGSTSGAYTVVVAIDPLDVMITRIPNNDGSNQYLPGSSLTLSCSAANAIDPQQYSWTSTCSVVCFVPGSDTQNVSRSALRAADNGVHTCTITDYVGNYGSASTTIEVNGRPVILYNDSPQPMNILLLGDPVYFEGVSASTLSVGTVRDPFFNDITNTEFVTIGGSDNPGYLNASISPSTTGQGMYRVTMQDENGTPYELLVGIFPPGYNVPINITNLREKATTSFLLICTTTGSPPASIEWNKDGYAIEESSEYSFLQELTDAPTATFTNSLLVTSAYVEAYLGTFTCLASDFQTNGVEQSITIEGVNIVPSNHIYIVGSKNENLTCSSGVDAYQIEWYYEGSQIDIYIGSAPLTLSFDLVTDVMNGAQYTCRVTSVIGVQEMTYNLSVAINIEEIEVSVIGEVMTDAGCDYSVQCITSFPEGITILPISSWLHITESDLNGTRITNEETVYSANRTIVLTLDYSPILANDKMGITCQANLTTPARPYKIIITTELSLTIHPELDVTIDASPTQNVAIDFQLPCVAIGGIPPFQYQWSSNCSRDCFVTNQTTSFVNAYALRLKDEGTFTCEVVDVAPCEVRIQSYSLNINVKGVGLYLEGAGPVEPHSIVQVDPSGSIGNLWCISAYEQENIGKLHSPRGVDLTGSTSGPTRTVFSNFMDDPGVLIIQTVGFTAEYNGVYYCAMPDENGQIRTLDFGLYSFDFNVPPVIVSIQTLDYSALTCASSGSPVTELAWYKDGVRYYGPEEADPPSFSLGDRVDANYTSVISLNQNPRDLIGIYECSTGNIFGVSSLLFAIKGLTILQGDMITVMADSTTKIMCTTDLPVNELQWLLGDQLLFSSSGAMEIELTVPLDGDDEYTLQVFTCKSIHTNGNQTASINVTYILLSPTPSPTPPLSSEPPTTLYIIIGAVGGGVTTLALIVLIIVALCCCCRQPVVPMLFAHAKMMDENTSMYDEAPRRLSQNNMVVENPLYSEEFEVEGYPILPPPSVGDEIKPDPVSINA